MQSGKAREGRWVLEFESRAPRRPDPLTGWSGGADTQAQVTLTFDTLEAAKAYAERDGIDLPCRPAGRAQAQAPVLRRQFPLTQGAGPAASRAGPLQAAAAA